MNTILAGLNGIAVGFNAAALLSLQRDEPLVNWLGVVICSGLMMQAVIMEVASKR